MNTPVNVDDGKKVQINYYSHGLKTFDVKFDENDNRVHFISECNTIKFSLNRADHEDCQYAALSLGILI